MSDPTTPTPETPEIPTPVPKSKLRRIGGYLAVCGVTLLVALCAYLLIQNSNQSEQLARRTPTLDYLVCHDHASDDLSIAVADYTTALRQLINLPDDASPEDRAKAFQTFNDAADEIDVRKVILRDATDKSLPVSDTPSKGRSCPTAPQAD